MHYTTETLIEKFKSIHGDTYDYSKVVYVGRESKVTIVCKKHGDFTQSSYSHTQGKGCRACAVSARADTRRLPLMDVLKRAEKIHKGKFDYSKVVYRNNCENVEVICPNHGSFFTSMANHFAGNDCPKCSQEIKNAAKRSNTKEFVEKALKVHGGRYDLSRVVYGKTNIDKVEIICKDHGSFFTRPANFLSGKGCPSCAKEGFVPHNPAWLYILKSTTGITKVGISYNADKRCKHISKDSKIEFKLIYKMHFESGQQALEIEQYVLQYLRANYEPIQYIFSGSTECFYEVPEAKIEHLIASKLLGC